MTEYRVIVVGGGSSGSVVARRLVDAGIAVTLLEAGGEDTNPAIHDPMRMRGAVAQRRGLGLLHGPAGGCC